MCIRDRLAIVKALATARELHNLIRLSGQDDLRRLLDFDKPVSYTHLRAHETVLDIVCRLLLEKKKHVTTQQHVRMQTVQHTQLTTIKSSPYQW